MLLDLYRRLFATDQTQRLKHELYCVRITRHPHLTFSIVKEAGT
jgi:hypothetical protein